MTRKLREGETKASREQSSEQAKKGSPWALNDRIRNRSLRYIIFANTAGTENADKTRKEGDCTFETLLRKRGQKKIRKSKKKHEVRGKEEQPLYQPNVTRKGLADTE